MPTRVLSAWLATPRPPSGTVPIRPTMAESASRNSGSATRAPNAGTASRRISPSWGLRAAATGRRPPRSGTHAAGPQAGYLLGAQPEPGQHRVGVSARPGRLGRDLGRG